MLQRGIYNGISLIAWWLIALYSLFNKKTRKYLQSRLGNKDVPNLDSSILFHCASLGEYEESLPFIEYCHSKFPSIPIVVSFFSNSGFEQVKGTDWHYTVYLPEDRFGAYKSFLTKLEPNVVYISKYEFWYGFLHACHKNDIPIYHLNTTISAEHSLNQWPRSLFFNEIKKIKHFYCVDKKTVGHLQSIGIEHASQMGDSRINRALQNALVSNEPNQSVHNITKPIVVFGSTWPSDEELILPFINNHSEYQYIFAPHDVGKPHIQSIQKQLIQSTRLSKYSKDDKWSCLLVDSIGQLKYLYQFATIVYIGGGQDHKIHNFLEASAFEVPVLFGKRHENMPLANTFVQNNWARIVSSQNEVEKQIIEFRFTDELRSSLHDFLMKNRVQVQEIIDQTLPQSLLL